MKLKDAETLLKLEKEKGPLKERWWCETDEGILLEAWPLGFARGSFRMADIFTVNPHFNYFALFEGDGLPHKMKVPKMGPYHLWEQEAYVYYLELREHMKKTLADLHLAPYAMRLPEHEENDNKPYPEDFNPIGPSIRPIVKHHAAVEWWFSGTPNLNTMQLRALKKGFIELLENFVTQGGPHGQGTTV